MNVTELKGVGAVVSKLLKRLGLESAKDLVENVPRDYDDYSKVSRIAHLRPGRVTIRARITSVTGRYVRRGMHITEALASDTSGSVRVVWFNQPYRAKSLTDEEYFLSGTYAQSYKHLALSNPSIEKVSDFPLHTARLVPRYRLTKGLSAHMLRKLTEQAFSQLAVTETLPDWLISSQKLIDRKTALRTMHFPPSLDELSAAKRRVAFEEVFEMVLASEINKRLHAQEHAASIPFNEQETRSFVDSLPYALTNDQRRAAWDIIQDMTSGRPMNRLLEGDVGSGKTVVAAIAAVNVVQAGFQVAFMAPTEILARQHVKTLQSTLPDVVRDTVVLMVGSLQSSKKKTALQHIASGRAQIVVGTHALIQESVSYNRLGLVIIDEQHRFGVKQRKLLQAKADTMPDVLNMTATPIPRSLMLTLYGELDASIIKQKPAGRLPVATRVVIPESRSSIYKDLDSVCEDGRQVFVVCPQIDDGIARSVSVASVHKQVAAWLSKRTVVALHGKMLADEKASIMQRFADGEIDVLVSTTVIEVGVDVPNATVMVIEAADMFGLAQLHQLRGRVGRGKYGGECILVQSDNTTSPQRLQKMADESDGFALAEYDLELRGPGAIYGTMQHGELDLRVAKLTVINDF